MTPLLPSQDMRDVPSPEIHPPENSTGQPGNTADEMDGEDMRTSLLPLALSAKLSSSSTAKQYGKSLSANQGKPN